MRIRGHKRRNTFRLSKPTLVTCGIGLAYCLSIIQHSVSSHTLMQSKYRLHLGLLKYVYIFIIRNLMGCVVLIYSGLVVNCKKLVTVMILLWINLAVGTENRSCKPTNNAISCIPKILYCCALCNLPKLCSGQGQMEWRR